MIDGIVELELFIDDRIHFFNVKNDDYFNIFKTDDIKEHESLVKMFAQIKENTGALQQTLFGFVNNLPSNHLEMYIKQILGSNAATGDKIDHRIIQVYDILLRLVRS
ncbi:hypothetical protein RF11_12007 [Thelohanellus kitauei]|uniref:Uncharacterized protein n=1 Tax=Thelohanellus kitauei TaxID=669202 RepID=A0A0C2IL83_THEKT|nr:hypothetical protein RF11_12007 [Thelohanellus kitauei]